MAKNKVHKQGTLDGLCGLYSVANAFTQLLGPDLIRHELPDDTFREAARGLPRESIRICSGRDLSPMSFIVRLDTWLAGSRGRPEWGRREHALQ